MELLTEEEGRIATLLARGALVHAVSGTSAAGLQLTPVFSEKRGVFVTLTEEGDLRGCIGFPYPVMPLGDAIREAGVAAALQDPRFPPVQGSELPAIIIEVTVLSVPQKVACDPADRPSHVKVGRHGLIVQGMGTSGLLLPQVATEYGWDSTTFLDHTCTKAGLPVRCWTKKGVEVLTFEGQIFHEGRPYQRSDL